VDYTTKTCYSVDSTRSKQKTLVKNPNYSGFFEG
jgi:hypothetical protein